MIKRKKIFLIFSAISLIAYHVLDGHFTRGMNRLRAGHFDLAMEIFEEAMSDEVESVDKIEAQYGMALCYWYGVEDVSPDRKLAAKMLENLVKSEMRKSDIAALTNAYYLLGLYYYGEGNDEKQALEYMGEAARRGYALAQFRLGRYYFNKSQESWLDVCGEYTPSDERAIEYLSAAVNNINLSRRNREQALEMLREIDVSYPELTWWQQFMHYVMTAK